MINKIKSKLKKLSNNRGSSFVLVIVSTTFLSILVSALLMGTLLAYKIKFYKLNSLNNFYSLEKSLDEIRSGIGSIVNEKLYDAYTNTAQLVVYYDDDKYQELDEDSANELFKRLFMNGLMQEENINDMKKVVQSFKGYISDDEVELVCDSLKVVFTDTSGKEAYIYCTKQSNGNIKYSLYPVAQSGYDSSNINTITFKNVTLRRTITLDSSNSKEAVAQGEYVQSITTDIVIGKPPYDVNWGDGLTRNSDSIYNYAVMADMGLEVTGKTADTKVNIKGNIYTASDYYNKDYNGSNDTKVTNAYSETVETKWGSTDSSLYSGIYVDGEKANLSLDSDVIVCSGTLAAHDGAQITLKGRTGLLSELWTDNIVIAGTKGGSIKAAANAYVYDDTELNAESSSLTFTKGTYFGYSYAADDVRSINLLRSSGNLATGYKLKSHFSDSAVIVNGKDSTVDLNNLDALYIAGKSYIEFSKVAASSVSEDEKKKANDANNKEVYVDGDNADVGYTTLKDYSTGQSLDVKSNQLIFLAQWEPVDDDVTVDEQGYSHVTLKFPKTFTNDASITELYGNFLEKVADGAYTVEAIKQTVSGHNYYYLCIQPGDVNEDGVDNDTAEEFVEKYYSLLSTAVDTTKNKLYNVVDYEDFDVKLILPSDDKIKASAAVTEQNSDDSLFVKSSSDTTLNVYNALKQATGNSDTFTTLMGLSVYAKTDEINKAYESLRDSAKNLATLTDKDSQSTEVVSNFINYMYVNMKDHLSVSDYEETDETTGTTTTKSAWDLVKYTKTSDDKYTYSAIKNSKGETTDLFDYNYSLTPLTKYIDFEQIFKSNISINATETKTGSVIVVNTGDVSISSSAANGSLQGMIICGGNVTFDSSVKSFKGMIITGGKLICNSSVNISSDASYMENLLNTCAKSGDADLTMLTKDGGLLLTYEAVAEESSTEGTAVSISDIDYNDIVEVQNWKKNVE